MELGIHVLLHFFPAVPDNITTRRLAVVDAVVSQSGWTRTT